MKHRVTNNSLVSIKRKINRYNSSSDDLANKRINDTELAIHIKKNNYKVLVIVAKILIFILTFLTVTLIMSGIATG